jgi:DNA-binding response OmpR family regulator
MASSILVVDDDENILTQHRMILEGEGYKVGTASTGEAALEKARKTKYDLAILDMFLPDIRGDEVAIKLRKMDDSIGIIFITGYDISLQIVESLNFNFYIFLKPISPEELLKAVENVLSIIHKTDLIWAQIEKPR